MVGESTAQTRLSQIRSNPHALDFIQGDFIGATVVELGGAVEGFE
jgi:hypothetical protein